MDGSRRYGTSSHLFCSSSTFAITGASLLVSVAEQNEVDAGSETTEERSSIVEISGNSAGFDGAKMQG